MENLERLQLREDRGSLAVRYIPSLSSTRECNDKKDSIEDKKNESDPKNIAIDIESEITLFYLHGSMASMSQFDNIMLQFHGKYNICAYDALGCGLSDKPKEAHHYSSSNMTMDVVELFRQYSSRRNIIIGHSYGTCNVARLCKFVDEHKDEFSDKEISMAILIATTDFVRDGGHPIFHLPVFALKWIHGTLTNSFLDKALSPNASLEVREQCQSSSGKNSMTIAKAFYQQFQWAREDDWKALSKIPILIIHGKDDGITREEGMQRLVTLLRNMNDNAVIEMQYIDDCGHLIMIEKPTELMQKIESFIDNHLSNNNESDQHRIERQ